MQGSVTRDERWKHAKSAALLVGGYLAGVAAFGSLVLVAGHAVAPLLTFEQRAAIVVGVMLVAGVGDVIAVRGGRLYPFAARRQAVQTLTYRWRNGRTVGFVWGFDAGFGAATYRVTSGLWVMAASLFLGLVGMEAALVYGAGFAAAFAAVVLWPVRPAAGESTNAAVSGRILRTARLRPLGQIAYIWLLPLAAGAVAWEAWG